MITRRLLPALLAVALAAGLAAGLAPVARAHEERPTVFPNPENVMNPPVARGDLDAGEIASPHQVVCDADQSAAAIALMPGGPRRAANEVLLGECGFSSIQAAINDAPAAGTTIYVLPGTYEETVAQRGPQNCGQPHGVMSYEGHLTCPHAQNLIAVMGDADTDGDRECNSSQCDLQIEGTGTSREDVIVTGGFDDAGQWIKLNGIRGDRADGLVLKHFTVQLFEFNAVYILETDGFLIDDVLTRWNDEYGFLVFSNVNGLIENCEAYNNADSGIYPGSASDLNGDERVAQPLDQAPLHGWSTEIKNCTSHHNTLGYSGTAGNSVYAHDNDFYANATGIATDSLFPNHPGLPQDHGWFQGNRIFSNNNNYYRFVHDGTCDKPPAERGYVPAYDQPGVEKWDGTVCPVVPLPVGTGMMIAGGNYNYLHGNQVYDNWRSGFRLIAVPAALRQEYDPNKAFDTSHGNKFADNSMGIDPLTMAYAPNGVDFWWDGGGTGNCWQGNTPHADAANGITSNDLLLPTCGSGGSLGLPLDPARSGPMVPCVAYDRSNRDLREPAGCSWFRTPPEPGHRELELDAAGAPGSLAQDKTDDVIAVSRG